MAGSFGILVVGVGGADRGEAAIRSAHLSRAEGAGEREV
jgi:hypothetical protein